MAQPPRLSDRNSGAKKPIIDAEWDEIEVRSERPRDESFAGSLWADVKRITRSIAIAAGVILVCLIVLGVAVADFSEQPEMAVSEDTPNEPDASDGPPGASSLAANTDDGDPDWQPSMLCRDDQVIGEVVNARRRWLVDLLTMMAAERSYILPINGNPIAEGATRARFAFPDGIDFVEMVETGADERDNVYVIQCRGTMEVRDAFKLPDDSWSPIYLSIPDARFNVRLGANGLHVEFPDEASELSRADMHFSAGTIPLQALRERSMMHAESE